MASVQVAKLSEIPPGTMKAFQIGDTRVLVVNCDGDFYAIDNTCTHAGGDLSRGRLEGFYVSCPRHGQQFDLRTGQSVAPPKIGFAKLRGADTKSYPVTIAGDTITVEVGA